MIIYWSMMLWSPIVYLFYSLSNKEETMLKEYNIRQGIQKKLPISYCIAVFGYFIFWIGMRRNFGDTLAYINAFKRMPSDFSGVLESINWDSKGPVFDLASGLFKCFISDNYTWWLMTVAIISGACILHTVRKYSCDFFLSSFIFIAMLTFMWMMNGIRQFVCVAILFAFCDLIKNKKFIIYTLVVLLLTTVHSTVIIMIPVYFLARSKPWSKMTMVFISGIILLCLFAEPFFNGVDTMLSGTSYEGAVAQFQEDDGVNPIRVAFYSLFPILEFWKKDELAEYYDKYPILPICINMSFVTALLYLVGMVTSGILIGRLPIYCEVYNLIIIPYLLDIGFKGKEKSIVKILLIIVFIFFFLLQTSGMGYDSELTGTIV